MVDDLKSPGWPKQGRRSINLEALPALMGEGCIDSPDCDTCEMSFYGVGVVHLVSLTVCFNPYLGALVKQDTCHQGSHS